MTCPVFFYYYTLWHLFSCEKHKIDLKISEFWHLKSGISLKTFQPSTQLLIFFIILLKHHKIITQNNLIKMNSNFPSSLIIYEGPIISWGFPEAFWSLFFPYRTTDTQCSGGVLITIKNIYLFLVYVCVKTLDNMTNIELICKH